MSVDESMERKDNRPRDSNKTEPNAKNWFPNKLCSACGEKNDAVKKCTACQCVWYCDKDCQNKHRKEHRKDCKRIKKELEKRGGKLDVGTELDIGPLGTLLPREECSICMRVLPIHNRSQVYAACCGKTYCCGCNLQYMRKTIEGNVERVGSGQTPVTRTCAFCRTAVPDSDEKILVQLRKRVELKDPTALRNMALDYGRGHLGLPVDQDKCIELLRESASLGNPVAQFQLGNFYDDGEMGLEQNEEEALKWWKKAAEGGDVLAQHNAGLTEGRNDDNVAAMRHLRLSASGGYWRSMGAVIGRFEDGLLQHEDLAESLRAFYLARAEMRSDDRMQYIARLKKTGEYEAEYNL